MGFTDGEGVDIVSLSGTVETDSYGNLMIDGGKTNYLLTSVPTLGVTLKEGDAVDGEGFAGNVLYTKGGESYQNFHLTMANVNGEDYVIDLNGVRSPMGGLYGGMMYGGRGSRSGMMGYDDGYGRGGMMGYGWNSDDSWTYSDDDDSRIWGPMGRGFTQATGEETTLEGTFELVDGFHPALVTGDGNYLIMMGHWTAADIPEGAGVEATGYAGSSLYNQRWRGLLFSYTHVPFRKRGRSGSGL